MSNLRKGDVALLILRVKGHTNSGRQNKVGAPIEVCLGTQIEKQS